MIIAIDPGPEVQSFVIFDGTAVVSFGDVRVAEMVEIIQGNADTMVAIEHIESFGMAVGAEIFQAVFNEGRMYAASQACRMIPRRDIKIHLCGNNRAKDGNIRQALIDKVGPVGTKKKPGPCYGVSNHIWSALAVAVTAFDLDVTPHEFFPAS